MHKKLLCSTAQSLWKINKRAGLLEFRWQVCHYIEAGRAEDPCLLSSFYLLHLIAGYVLFSKGEFVL